MTNYTFNGQTYDIPADLTKLGGTGHAELITAGTGDLLPRQYAIMVDIMADAARQMRTTSASSVSIGTGTKTFVLQDNLPFQAGEWVFVVDSSTPTNYMYGTVSSYTAGTKTLVLSVASGDTSGSGTITSWKVQAAGQKGATGSTGASGYAYASTTGGTSTAYTATFSPTLGVLTAGQPLIFIPHTNSGASPTLNPDGLGAKSLYINGAAAGTNSLKSGQVYIGVYDGTNIQVISGGGASETLATPVVGAGASQTLNLANGNVFDLTGTASTACTLSFSGIASSGTISRWRLIWRQPAVTGGASLVYPGSVKWIGQPAPQTTAPSLTTTAAYVHELEFFSVDGGTTVYAYLVGGVSGTSPSSQAGLYVVIGSGGNLSSSTNGTSYSLQSSQLGGADLRKILAGNGRIHFIAPSVALNTTWGRYTTNGTSFTNYSGVANIHVVNDIAYCANGNLIVRDITTNSSTARFLTSTDHGASWTEINPTGLATSTRYLFTVNSNDVLAIRCSGSTTNFCTSTDGGASYAAPNNHSYSGGTGSITTVTYLGTVGGNYVVGAANGEFFYKTTANLTATTMTFIVQLSGSAVARGMIYTGTKFVAWGDAGKVSNATTIAGTYTARTTGVSGNITAMGYNGGVLMLVTDTGEVARSTTDGDSWSVISTSGTPAPNPFGGNALYFVKYRLGYWYTGGAGGKFGQSSDGTSFALVTTNMGTATIYDFEAF